MTDAPAEVAAATEATLRAEIARLERKVERERAARLEAESIAEKSLRDLYVEQQQLRLLQRCAVAANEASDPIECFHEALEIICEFTGWPVGHAFLLDENSGDLVSARCWYLRNPELFQPFRVVTEALRFARGVGLPGRVLASHQAEFAADITRHPNFPRKGAARATGLNSGFAFPVFVGAQVAAVLEFFAEVQTEPDEQFLNNMTQIGMKLGRVVERARAAQQLQHSHEETEMLVSSISAVLIGVDADGLVTRWNGAAENCFGLKAAEVMGKPLGDVPIEWRWEEVSRAVGRCTDYRVPVELDDVSFAQKNGEPGSLHLLVNPGWAGLSKRLDAVLVGVDTTQRRRLERKLQQVQRLEAIGELAAGVAHELNSPIQFITDNLRFVGESLTDLDGALQKLLEAKGPVPGLDREEIDYLRGELPRAIQQSLDGAVRVAAIVRAMKHHAHPGGEHLPVDLNVLAESSITITSNEWKYVADLETDLAPDLPLVLGDGAAIGQVIINLIVNAAHAIGSANERTGRQRGLLRVRTFASETHGCVSIEDNGTGIPSEIRERIYDPFFTTKDVGKGTGQGLFLVHSTVEKHRGTIRLESEVGCGTTFTIELPRS